MRPIYFRVQFLVSTTILSRVWLGEKMIRVSRLLISVLLFAVCVSGYQKAYALSALASVTYSFADADPQTANGNAGTGNFSIGPACVSIGSVGAFCQPSPGTPAQTTFPYAVNAGMGAVGFNANLTGRGTTAKARAVMIVDPPIGKYHGWEIFLNTLVQSSFGGEAGEAEARGHDPDFFDPIALSMNPIFEETVTLSAGSSVFGEDQFDTAFATMDRTSSLLTDPIFSIELSSLGPSLIDATVAFNAHPSLSFSTTASALEALLEDPLSGLGTLNGLMSDISFRYSWDLSMFTVDSNDTISGGGVTFAASGVPEPSTLVLMVSGLAVLGAIAWGRHRLNSPTV